LYNVRIRGGMFIRDEDLTPEELERRCRKSFNCKWKFYINSRGSKNTLMKVSESGKGLLDNDDNYQGFLKPLIIQNQSLSINVF
jgi:hypothetical protein